MVIIGKFYRLLYTIKRHSREKMSFVKEIDKEYTILLTYIKERR